MTSNVKEHAPGSGHVRRRRSPSERRQRSLLAVAVVGGLGFVVGLVAYLTLGPSNGYYDCQNDGTRGPQHYSATVRHGEVVDLPRAYKPAPSIDATFGSDVFRVTFVELGTYVGRGAADRELTFTCQPKDFEND